MRARASVVVFAALLVGIASCASAPGEPAAPKSFTFYGAGWGHGVGMSQWGAYGLAEDGWSHRRILEHFFTGTTVREAPRAVARIRVGLVQDRDAIHVTARRGPVELRVGQGAASRLIGKVPNGFTWTVGIRRGRFRILDAAGRVVGDRLWGGRRRPVYARYVRAGAMVELRETSYRYNRGHLEFNLYRCGECRLRLIAVVPFEKYLYGVAEVPNDWPMEALKAQAVAARTYALERVQSLGQHRAGCNCAVYASPVDQVYAGWDKEGAYLAERWVRAVDSTAGEAVLYDGRPINAHYTSSSGGYTENSEDVWVLPLPYLRGVCDPGDYTPENPDRVWRVTLTGEQIGDRIAAATGKDVGEATSFSRIVRGVSGRIVSAVVKGDEGRVKVSGERLKFALGLRDAKVWINKDRSITGAIRERYDRLMCKPGLPAGPKVRVAGGHRQAFERGALYRNARRGATLWLHGPIYRKYLSLGQVRSLLGMPRSDVLRLKGVGGERARFEAGAIYRKEATGAHELHGPVLEFFLSVGGVRGKLGFPTSDVKEREDGTSSATFEGGTVVCSPGGECRIS